MDFELEVTGPDGERVVVPLVGEIEVGRETDGLMVADPSVSRRHLVLRQLGDHVEVEDLNSANGTVLNKTRLRGTKIVGDGALIEIGDTKISIRLLTLAATVRPAENVGAPTTVVKAPAPRRVLPQRPFEAVEGGLVTVNYFPGSVGADVANSVHDTAKRARKLLSGFGSEAWGTTLEINIVDPFSDPEDPTRLVTGGSVIDADSNTIWMVVTPESPPEKPHRAMAILFGAALPCADSLDYLIEGYGVHLAGASEPSPEIVASHPEALEEIAEDERGDLVASFVGYLITREDDAVFRRLLTTPANQLTDTWKELYGRSAQSIESAWRSDHENEAATVGTTEFLKLSWRYLRPYRWRQIEVFGYMLLSLAFTVAYPFVTKRLFDEAIPSGEFSQVLTLLAALGAAFAVTLVAGLRQTYLNALISTSVVRDLQEELFAKLQTVTDAWVARHPQGDVLSRLMNDVRRVEAGLTTAIDGGIFQVISLVVSTIIMLRVNLFLGLIVLVGAPIVGLIYRQLASGAQERSIAVQEESGALMTLAAENYQGNAVVKVFRLARHERTRFRRSTDRLVRAQMRMSLFGGLFGVAVDSIMTILRLLVIGLGAWLIVDGQLTIGGLVAFLGIMGEVLGPVVGLTSLGQSLQTSVGAIIRIDEVLDAEPEPAGEELPAFGPLENDIELERISLSYSPERRALDQVDVTIKAGTRVAFVGPSGSGKSTILRLLMRLYEPDEGTIRIDGVDTRERSLDSLRAQMGVVFQDSFLFDATVRENIALGAVGASEEEIIAACEAAEVASFVDNLSRGYDTLVGEAGRNLSGGQRQRVAIARALLGNPSILLLDEATSALDPRTERQISETLERAGTGRTVIAITHRLTSVTDYDRIFVVDAGRIVEQGSHDELVSSAGLYARLWAEQTGEPVPALPPFDLAGVVSKLPLFVDLSPEEIRNLTTHFTRLVLAPNTVLNEGGQLIVVAEGRGEIEALDPTVVGPPRQVGPGEVFGLNAILGNPTDSQLRALEPMTLLSLTEADLHTVRANNGQVEEAASGRSSMAPTPKGRLLVRSTLGPASANGRSTIASRGISAVDVAAVVKAARAPVS